MSRADQCRRVADVLKELGLQGRFMLVAYRPIDAKLTEDHEQVAARLKCSVDELVSHLRCGVFQPMQGPLWPCVEDHNEVFIGLKKRPCTLTGILTPQVIEDHWLLLKDGQPWQAVIYANVEDSPTPVSMRSVKYAQWLWDHVLAPFGEFTKYTEQAARLAPAIGAANSDARTGHWGIPQATTSTHWLELVANNSMHLAREQPYLDEGLTTSWPPCYLRTTVVPDLVDASIEILNQSAVEYSDWEPAGEVPGYRSTVAPATNGHISPFFPDSLSKDEAVSLRECSGVEAYSILGRYRELDIQLSSHADKESRWLYERGLRLDGLSKEDCNSPDEWGRTLWDDQTDGEIIKSFINALKKAEWNGEENALTYLLSCGTLPGYLPYSAYHEDSAIAWVEKLVWNLRSPCYHWRSELRDWYSKRRAEYRSRAGEKLRLYQSKCRRYTPISPAALQAAVFGPTVKVSGIKDSLALSGNSLSKSDTSEDANSTSDTPDAPPDGPVPPSQFRWQGKLCGDLEPLPLRLIKFLWESPNRTAEFGDLAEPVWRDREASVESGMVGSAQKKANAFFAQHQLPFSVSRKSGWVKLESKPVEPTTGV